jgi:hypothetical protein
MPPAPLRRTLSAPAVRAGAAPYPSVSPPTTPRRCARAGSSSRRVLADLEWWHVQDGQREVARAVAADGENTPAGAPAPPPLVVEDVVQESPLWSLDPFGGPLDSLMPTFTPSPVSIPPPFLDLVLQLTRPAADEPHP